MGHLVTAEVSPPFTTWAGAIEEGQLCLILIRLNLSSSSNRCNFGYAFRGTCFSFGPVLIMICSVQNAAINYSTLDRDYIASNTVPRLQNSCRIYLERPSVVQMQIGWDYLSFTLETEMFPT